MTSVTSSNSGIIDVNYSNDQVSVVAHKVGTTTLTIKFKTKDNINTVYTYNVKVAPTVWTAGKTADNKPILWRNWEDKSMYLSGRASYTSANEVIVHGSTAFVMMRKDVSNSYTEYASGTAVILKGTGVHGGGYLNTYKDGLTGASKKYCVFPKSGTTRYIAGIPHMWVDKNNNVYYTSAFRDNNTDNCDNWVSTNVYKNKTLLMTSPPTTAATSIMWVLIPTLEYMMKYSQFLTFILAMPPVILPNSQPAIVSRFTHGLAICSTDCLSRMGLYMLMLLDSMNKTVIIILITGHLERMCS